MRRVASAAERIKGSPPKPPHVDPVAPTMRALPPRWLRGDIEPPAGEETRGTATFSYYTEEQQQRLGVDRQGNPVEPPPPHVDPVAPTMRALPPRWLRGDIEP